MNKFNLFKQDLSELYSDKVPINHRVHHYHLEVKKFGLLLKCLHYEGFIKTIYLNKFLYASRSIQELMPKILEVINKSQVLK